MTVAKALSLQGEVYIAVNAAVAVYSLGVHDSPPSPRPNEFIRIDGFEVSDQSYKTGEQGRHSFEVHHFDGPIAVGAVRDRIVRSKTVLAVIHAALMAARFQGRKLRHEYLTVITDEDGVTAHGTSRYTVILI